jgi:hypothetical protein
VSANTPAWEPPSPRRSRAMPIALGLGALVLFPLAGMTILRAMSHGTEGAPGPDVDANLTTWASASATVPVEVAPSVSVASALAAAPEAGSPSASGPARTLPIVHDIAAPPSSPEAHGTKKAGPGRSTCNPPFTFDSVGTKHYKPECF